MPLDHLLRSLWARRWRIALAAGLLFALGAAVVLGWPRLHVAQAVVAPAETTSIAISTLLSPAPLVAGGLLDSRPAGNFAVYLDSLRSAEAVAMLARDTPLLDHLTALRGIGPMGAIRRAFGLRLTADLDDAQDWLERTLGVTQGVATVTFTITLAHRDRAAALDVLTRLHALAEAKVRGDLAELARRRILAIEARLAAERDQFLRTMLYDLLGQQQRAALVVAADEAVAARIVSAPMVEIRPSLPNRSLLVVAPLAALTWAACTVLLGAHGPRRRAPQYELPLGVAHRIGAD